MKADDLHGIASGNASEVWPKVEHWIADACADEGGSYEASDILHFIQEQDMQLWVASSEAGIDSVCVTEIRETKRRKTCWVLILAGKNIDRWLEHRSIIADWAKSQGCVGRKAMKSLARRGYMRLCPEYQCTHVLLERDL